MESKINLRENFVNFSKKQKPKSKKGFRSIGKEKSKIKINFL